MARPAVEARMRFALMLAVLAAPLPAAAQIAAPADGLYEDFSSIFMEPSVPLAAAPSALPRWVDVRTTGSTTTVTFEPDARVVWRVRWGPHGPVRKTTLVDGVTWTRSRFAYDAGGALVGKTVTGPGAGGGLSYAYTTDPITHEIRTRTATLATGVETVDVAYGSRGVVVSVTRAGVLARRDRFDAQRRLLETHFYDRTGVEAALLRYVRDAHGAVHAIRRRIGTHHGRADATHPDATLESIDVFAIAAAPIERHEAFLLLGSPTLNRDEGRGVARDLLADFASDGCWMNQTSALHFDPTGLLVSASAGCICGFCVAASSIEPEERAAALGVQEHWTRGPWVRIDGVEVTADHALVTADGPRAAGTLAVGDVVRAADGSAHRIESLETLDDDLRLGVNLATSDGTFSAGGLAFVSETPRACVP